MKIIDTRESMLKIIRAVEIGGKTYEEYVNELCDRLMDAGAFVPPVKCGETVFAVLDSVLGEEPDIEPWIVKGFGVDRYGELFVEGMDGEQFLVGTEYCLLDKAEAERQLAVYMQAYREQVESDEVEECLERMNKEADEDE